MLVLLGNCKEMESSSSNTSRDAGVTDLLREVDSSFAIGYADLVCTSEERQFSRQKFSLNIKKSSAQSIYGLCFYNQGLPKRSSNLPRSVR